MDKAVREYMAKIGRRGGKSGKGTQWRKEVCRHAAIVRWRTYRDEKRRRAIQDEQNAEKKQTREEQAEICETCSLPMPCNCPDGGRATEPPDFAIQQDPVGDEQHLPVPQVNKAEAVEPMGVNPSEAEQSGGQNNLESDKAMEPTLEELERERLRVRLSSA